MPDNELLRRAVKAGLIGGVVMIYVALVGMIEKFNDRNLVHDVVTLSKVMIVAPPFLVGYLVARPRLRGGQLRRAPGWQSVAAGALGGLVVALVTVAAIALDKSIGVPASRAIFVSASPVLISILLFGHSLPVGAVVLAIVGVASGAAGAALPLLPERRRRPLVIGLTVTFLGALLQRVFPQMLDQLGVPHDGLYSSRFKGFTWLGALVVFGVSVVLTAVWMARGTSVRERLSGVPQEGRRVIGGVGAMGGLLVLGILPLLLGSNLSNVLGNVGIFVLMGLGLNIVVGYAGLLDLGYVAFFAVGAYMTALFTGAHVVTSLGATADPSFSLHLNFYVAVPLVILCAAFVGLLIGAPVLRLRGDYLAIVTLGFGEIARVLVTSDWLKPILGGAQGLRDVTSAPIAGVTFRDPVRFYWLVLGFCMLAVYVSWRLAGSRVGRAWNAMREDEQVAEAMGISTIKYKLLAFAMGASIGCLSGALFAVKIGSLAPSSFDVLVSITVLALIILGGMGSIPGVIVGGLVLIGIPGFLQEFDEFRLLLYGAVLVGIMILRPQGLIPNVRRSRELHEDERGQDQWFKTAGGEEAVAVGATGDPE
jgi:branched-chain amino acid transport system permease protein